MDPLFHLHIWLFVKARRETPDFIGCKFGRLSVNFAFVILLDTLRPFHSFKRVKEIRVYYAILLLNSKEGVGQYGSLFALTRPTWDQHSSFFINKTTLFTVNFTITSMGFRLVARHFCWTATPGLACSPASTVYPGLGHTDM